MTNPSHSKELDDALTELGRPAVERIFGKEGSDWLRAQDPKGYEILAFIAGLGLARQVEQKEPR